MASRDPRNSEAVMDALARINRERRITVLCSLHSVALAQRDCSRAVALAAGRVVYDGTTAALTPDALETVYGARSVEEIEEAA
ncbi:MAG: hypothetical protein COY86_06605 [Rhodobacterales bacterium CG_4_10_14_0_8_um_filter_70_9]|nr:MAG: hypothetical protein COY86_06605 [Rhodobacterales bacterium CG_4_10_14_0_8_um_filter_70_9]